AARSQPGSAVRFRIVGRQRPTPNLLDRCRMEPWTSGIVWGSAPSTRPLHRLSGPEDNATVSEPLGPQGSGTPPVARTYPGLTNATPATFQPPYSAPVAHPRPPKPPSARHTAP